MKTNDEMIAQYVGDRLLTEEVRTIDYIHREDGWQFEIVLNNFSVIGLSEERFDRLFIQNKVSQVLFTNTLVGRMLAKLGEASNRMEIESQVKAATLVLYAVKDDEQKFNHWLQKLTGGTISIQV